MVLAIAALLLVGTPAEPADAAAAPAVTAEASAEDTVDLGTVGLALAGGGAALAASTVVAATLVESLNTPDQEGQPRNERLIQGSGLLTTGVVSVGAALMFVGGVLVLDDLVFGPARQQTAPPVE